MDSAKQGNSYVFNPEGHAVSVLEGRINWYGRDPGWEDILGFRGRKDVENQLGEWNRLECIAQGDSLSFFLNGELVNRAFNVRPSKGRIQIQSEGAEIFIRRLDIKPIAFNGIGESPGSGQALPDR